MVDIVPNDVWYRKHDDPRALPRRVTVAYPKNLADVIELCRRRRPDEFLHAAGSHYALSDAAISDTTYIDTHDPNFHPFHPDYHQAMGQTLQAVIPGCLNGNYLDRLAEDDSYPYLVHVQAGKRIYQLYAELDEIQPLIYPQPKNAEEAALIEPEFDGADPPYDANAPAKETLAGRMKMTYGRPQFNARYAFPTLGSAGFQTIVGAFSTGTHGGDFDRGPVSDCIVAMHLVVDGGDHYWIEPSPSHDRPAMTNNATLYARYNRADPRVKFGIIRDDAIFNAVLVSAGRFGVIYSVVVKAMRQHMLHQQRRLSTWSTVKDDIKNRRSKLYQSGDDNFPNHFLQIAINLSPCAFFSDHQVGVTKRWTIQYPGDHVDLPGRESRVGGKYGAFNKVIQAYPYKKAGNSNSLTEDGNPSFLQIACRDKSFLRGILLPIIEDLERFTTDGTVGPTIAAVGYAAGPGAVFGLLALLPQLLALLVVLRTALQLIDDTTRFGEFINNLKNSLIGGTPPGTARAAGVFVWQLVSYGAFSSQQKEQDIEAVSYAILDEHDYLLNNCLVNVDSMEVFFDSTSETLIAFIDQLLAFEAEQMYQGKATVGYASIRFTGPTRATLGEQKHPITAVVEVSVLKDVAGGEELISFACDLARSETLKGILHWGQRNDCTQKEIESRFGDTAENPGGGRLGEWRNVLAQFTDNGRLNGFSNAFSQRTGLEVVQPRIGSFFANTPTATTGDIVVLHWDCRSNPPGTSGRLVVRYQWLVGFPVEEVLGENLPLEGNRAYQMRRATGYEFKLTLSLTSSWTRAAVAGANVEVND